MKHLSDKTYFENNFFEQCYFFNLNSIEKLVLYRCDYNCSYYHRDLFDIVNVNFPSTLNNAVNKRQAEYLAGRYAAMIALQKLECRNTNVPVGKHRSPIWPEGIVASITHTNTSAICATAYRTDIEFLGIDLENWFSNQTVQEIKSSIIHPAEEELLSKNVMGFERAFTLAFSAKETLFKALYPTVGYYFDFSAAEIVAISARQKTFDLILCQDLTQRLISGTRFSGHFNFDSRCINTLIAA